MNPRHLLSLLLLCAAGSLLAAEKAASSPGCTLLFDQYHTNQKAPPTRLQALGSRLGITIQSQVSAFTPEALAGATIVQIQAPLRQISSGERAALIDFVNRGGSLFVITDQEERVPLAPSEINALLAAFGMEFTADLPYLHNCGALAKAGEIVKADREIPYSGGRAVKGGTPFSTMLGEDGKPSPFVHGAYVVSPGGGRVIALSEAMVVLFLGKPDAVRLSGVPRDPSKTAYWGKDSEAFMEDVLRWLAHREAREG